KPGTPPRDMDHPSRVLEDFPEERPHLARAADNPDLHLRSLLQDLLFYGHPEVAAGLLDAPQHPVAGSDLHHGPGTTVFIHQPDGLGVLEDEAVWPAICLGLDEEK